MLAGDCGGTDLGVLGVVGVEVLNGEAFDFDPTDMGLNWDDTINEHLDVELEGSGLLHFCDITIRRHNTTLIRTFVDRWNPETNTFHMPFGEMTITLHDVEQIMGIRCSGRVAWIYEYFPAFQRGMVVGWNGELPRATYRKQLDGLTTLDVRWTPYGLVKDDSVSYYHGCIRFLEFNEAYMPDRVTQQFGRI
ncbi:hypothetical protein LIER_40892 [Lithospermum erythrorhizon]|uniref:Aminotransferase-like plant mobile domain-containing protein n=1 Tax=Lithospermum erythrorhizon TaxID=34254 RepID=A0AAV3R1F2_LITER